MPEQFRDIQSTQAFRTLLCGDILSRAAGERDPDAIAPPLAEPTTREEMGSDFNSSRAVEVYSQLKGAETGDYELFKNALLREFGLTPEIYRKRFRSQCKTREVTYLQLANRTQGYARKWTAGAQTKEDLLDLFVLEHVYEQCPSDLRVDVGRSLRSECLVCLEVDGRKVNGYWDTGAEVMPAQPEVVAPDQVVPNTYLTLTGVGGTPFKVPVLVPELGSSHVGLGGFWLAGRSRESGQGSLPKPSISVSPGGVIPMGGNVTIRCRHQRLGLRFLLYKDEDGNYLNYTDPAGSEAEFPITSARREQSGNYTCRYSDRTGPAAYSEPSDPVQIIVADPSLPRPSISLSPTGVTAPGADVTIRCQGQRRDVRFFLHKAGDLNPPRHMDPAGDGDEFRIPTVGRQHGGSYSCSYRLQSEPFISSEPSDPVQLVVAGGSESPAHLGQTSPIIAGVSAAAAILLLLLLLLVAFVCFRKTRANASMDEGKEPQTLPQEPDPGADGLTYAELDCQVLQAKRGGPAPEPAESSMYAVINNSPVLYFYCTTPQSFLLPCPQISPPQGTAVITESPNVPSWWVQPTKVSEKFRQRHENLTNEPTDGKKVESDGRGLCHPPLTACLFVNPEGSYPKPSISVRPGGVIPVGGNVTIQGGHQYLGMTFLLYKAGDGNYLTYTDPAGSEAEFPITRARREHGGSYTCRYSDRTGPAAYSEPSDPVQIILAGEGPSPAPRLLAPHPARPPGVSGQERSSMGQGLGWGQISHPQSEPGRWRQLHLLLSPNSDPDTWSEPSDPVQLVVAGEGYPKPSISLRPSGGLSPGGAGTIQCRGQRLGMRFMLNKDGRHFQTVDSDGFEAVFTISNVSWEDGGYYTCSYHSRSEPFAVSYPSDPVELVVRDRSLPRPSISLSPTGVTAPGADVTIRCQGQRRDVRFFLHKVGDLNPQQHVDPAGDGAEFRIPTVGRQHGGSYSCSYRPQSQPFVSSQPSNPVQLVVADERPGSTSPLPAGPSEGGTDPTQPGAAPAPTRPGSAGPDGSELPAPPGLTSPIIAGVSAAAAGLLLLLLVAFVCFRKTRARKGAAPRPSSTSPLRVLKTPAQQDPIYSSIDEGKETQTLPQEPDPGADGLTYAELDGRALHTKRGGLAPAPETAQSSVYAAINVSRGAPQ
ncbi:immunoglobulin superfamily member 1-like [Trachemys scripta elegans]|uniref:immunoglobulin superfamily member 1-like n=1 Tax=Trachemys scripta elegans TaxID=31138 RepID=UPI00155587FB|nr:immunoglobulin superfamily member 1-like [Trachemys scripta elegans]